MENEKNVEVKDLAVPKEETLVLAGDPQKQMEYAVKSSQILVQILAHKPKKVMINGEQYLEFEDWQTLGRFYGATVGIEWTKPIEREGKVWGYEAKAIVYIKGEIVSSAEAMTTRDERNWANRDEFTLRSMAQTRASAKALRNVLAWVAVLGGFRPTPVEDMPSDVKVDYIPQNRTTQQSPREAVMEPIRKKAQRYMEADKAERAGAEPEAEVIQYDDVPPPEEEVAPWNRTKEIPKGDNNCITCGKPVTDKVRDYSIGKYGVVYCYEHQPK